MSGPREMTPDVIRRICSLSGKDIRAMLAGLGEIVPVLEEPPF
jgi:hypothetical protein